MDAYVLTSPLGNNQILLFIYLSENTEDWSNGS